jgi:DNA-directed RNA polymerase specialized sigma24 family protein
LPISSYSDNELLSALRQDDEKAFAELFDRYWKQVHTMAYTWGLSMDATQEIVQNVFISLWEQRATLSIIHLPSYLSVEIRNCVLHYIDSQLDHGRRWDYYKQFNAQHAQVTDHDVKDCELMEAPDYGMNDPQEKSKKIFSLHLLEGVSMAEIVRSLLSLKRRFNIISHNQQKG